MLAELAAERKVVNPELPVANQGCLGLFKHRCSQVVYDLSFIDRHFHKRNVKNLFALVR